MGIAGKMVACGALLCAAWNAGAADSGFYFGAVGGAARYDFEKQSPYLQAGNWFPASAAIVPAASFQALPPSLSIAVAFGSPLIAQWQPQDDRNSSVAGGLLAGYRIMRYAAIEVSYLNLGKLDQSHTYSYFPILIPAVYFNRQLETSGPTASVLGILPLSEQWSVYLRAGLFVADMELDVELNGTTRSTDASTESLLVGVGAQYDFGKRWSMRADFQRFNDVGELRETGRADVNLLTVGVIFRL